MLRDILIGLDRRMSVAVVYTLFSLISLVAAVVLFGILHSTGALSFVTEGYVKQAEFGGSFAGFLATLIFLIRSYNSTVERAWLIPLSQVRPYLVAARSRQHDFGPRFARCASHPVAFRLPSFCDVALA